MTFSNNTSNTIIFTAEVSRWIRIRDVVLTVLAWFIYFYLIQDSFPFIGDIVRWAWGGFDGTTSYVSFKIVPTIISYAEVILAFAVVFIGWALYNQVRFRGKNRRKFSLPVTSNELAEMYQLTPGAVDQWQQTKSLIMHHDSNGYLMQINVA